MVAHKHTQLTVEALLRNAALRTEGRDDKGAVIVLADFYAELGCPSRGRMWLRWAGLVPGEPSGCWSGIPDLTLKAPVSVAANDSRRNTTMWLFGGFGLEVRKACGVALGTHPATVRAHHDKVERKLNQLMCHSHIRESRNVVSLDPVLARLRAARALPFRCVEQLWRSGRRCWAQEVPEVPPDDWPRCAVEAERRRLRPTTLSFQDLRAVADGQGLIPAQPAEKA
jgi:hypothetical protein